MIVRTKARLKSCNKIRFSSSSLPVQYELEITSRGAIHFAINYGTQKVFNMDSSDNLFPFEEWVHVAVTYDLKEHVVSGEPHIYVKTT